MIRSLAVAGPAGIAGGLAEVTEGPGCVGELDAPSTPVFAEAAIEGAGGASRVASATDVRTQFAS